MLRITLFLVTILLFAHLTMIGQVDSLHLHSGDAAASKNDDEFNLFLLVFALLFLGIMVIVGVLLVCIAAICLLCIAGLIAAGVFSVALGAGIYKQSFSVGIRVALYLIVGIIGSIGGTAIAYVVEKIFKPDISMTGALITGGLTGLVGGILGSLLIIWLVRKIFVQFKHKLKTISW